MKLLDEPLFAVEREMIFDIVGHERAELVVHDERAAVAKSDGEYKCVFADIADVREYIDKFGVTGKLCLLNMPLDAPEKLGFEADACKSFAYLDRGLPPIGTRKDLDVRRLAPSLAETLLGLYHSRGGSYTVSEMRELMAKFTVLGALSDGKLAGFIGRHCDGNMGMLTVLEEYRRRGVGAELERDMISLIMLENRVPLCDVYADNAPSIALQEKLGLTAARAYTFWTHTERMKA